MLEEIKLFINKVENKKSSIFNLQAKLEFNEEKEILFISRAINLLKVILFMIYLFVYL